MDKESNVPIQLCANGLSELLPLGFCSLWQYTAILLFPSLSAGAEKLG